MQAIVAVAERIGVEFKFNAPVSRILLSEDKSTARGIVLESGEELTADLVICNADLVYAYNNLLPASSQAKSLQSRPGSCSSVSFYWSLDRQIPELRAHNIFLADEYAASFDRIFKEQDLPIDPSFYVNVPSRVDASAAPAGKDTCVVLVPCGHLLSEAEGKGLVIKTRAQWDELITRARTAVQEVMEARLGVRIQEHITHEIVNEPASWQSKFNLDRGCILGLSHSFFNVLSFRPATNHSSIRNLYFVGASTHPGTGVPIVLAGSKIVSEQILDEAKMTVPWTRGMSLSPAGPQLQGKKERNEVDAVHTPPLLNLFHVAAIALGVLVALGVAALQEPLVAASACAGYLFVYFVVAFVREKGVNPSVGVTASAMLVAYLAPPQSVQGVLARAGL